MMVDSVGSVATSHVGNRHPGRGRIHFAVMLTRAPHFRFVDLSYFLFFPVSPSIKWCLKVNCALLSHAYHVVHPRFEAPVTSHRESSLDGKCSAAQSLAPIVASLQLPLRNSLAASIARSSLDGGQEYRPSVRFLCIAGAMLIEKHLEGECDVRILGSVHALWIACVCAPLIRNLVERDSD